MRKIHYLFCLKTRYFLAIRKLRLSTTQRNRGVCLHIEGDFSNDRFGLKGIYRAVRTNLEESGVNTLFLTFGTLHWNERQGGREYAAPILLVPVDIVPVKKLMERCRQLSC